MSARVSFWYRYRYWLLVLLIILLALVLLLSFPSTAHSKKKQFTLLEGGMHLVQETSAFTVGEALRELGIDLVYADESQPAAYELLLAGTEVRLRRAIPVTVRGPNGIANVFTKAETVEGLLQQIGFTLSQDWAVRPELAQAISRGSVVDLVHLETEDQEIIRTLTYGRRYKTNPEVVYGQEKILQEGKNGERVDRYAIRYENGKEVERELVYSQVTIPRQDLIIEQGVRVAVGQSLGVVRASYYADYFHGRRTANGETFYMDRLTAAHRKLPFGTIVKVTNQENGQSVIVPINDRGPYIAGREIDLSRGAFAAISPLSRGVIKVKLEIVSDGKVALR